MRRELDNWERDFAAFPARFAHLFARGEPRQQCRKYLRGLMAKVERKDCWQLAETVGDATPDSTQRILYQARWDADAARDILQQFVVERFGDADGIAIVDETSFVKKGTRSVGVKRQDSGTVGKIENCQVGVFLSYVSDKGHAFLDRRLYLPQDWCQDRERRQIRSGHVTRGRVPTDLEHAASLTHEERIENFETLAEAIDQTYAQFVLKQIDWVYRTNIGRRIFVATHILWRPSSICLFGRIGSNRSSTSGRT